MMSIEAFLSFTIGLFLVYLFSMSTAAPQPNILALSSYQQLQDAGEVLYLTGALNDAALSAEGDPAAGVRFQNSLAKVSAQSPLCITAYIDRNKIYSECGSGTNQQQSSAPVFSITRTLVKNSGFSTLRLEGTYP
ncbi:Uncharacterised protein [Candidatus Gugararchaeum adminiculabundum]|nr:Uncharacterised protein [Candidatus Gugararchaeum adminiculabundum]